MNNNRIYVERDRYRDAFSLLKSNKSIVASLCVLFLIVGPDVALAKGSLIKKGGSFIRKYSKFVLPPVLPGPVPIPLPLPPTPIDLPHQKKDSDLLGQVSRTSSEPVATLGKLIVNSGKDAIDPSVHIVRVIAGGESLPNAAKSVIHDQGTTIASVGKAVAEFNDANHGFQVIAAENIAGNIGKVALNITGAPDQLAVDFAGFSIATTGNVIAGNAKLTIADVEAGLLSVALKSAEIQFEADSKPLPDNIRKAFAAYYPTKVLDSARWALGSISISVPDLTIKYQDLENHQPDYAVTVGHITVFSVDPANNLHWWAHELQHQVQYESWGFDQFASEYVTDCLGVENAAESKAAQVAPLPPGVPPPKFCQVKL